MSELQAHFETWGAGAIHGSEAISLVKQIWDLGTKEGYTSERGRLASDAVWVAAAHAEYVDPMLPLPNNHHARFLVVQ